MLVHSQASTSSVKKGPTVPPEKKYKCKFCNRAFSRSEHRSRHERSHTKERPFQCMKCRSTFVRRDLLLRHDRTVHAKDGGIPLHSDAKRRSSAKASALGSSAKSPISIDTVALEQIEASSDGLVDLETAAMLMTDLHHKATAAMRNAGVEPYGNSLGTSVAQPSSLMEQPSITYPSGAVSLPQAPWDFVSESVTNTMHPFPSRAVSSQASQKRNVKARRNYPTSTNDDRVTDPKLTTSPETLPKTQRQNIKAPQVRNEDERNLILENIRINDKEGALPDSFHLPELPSINHFLSTYFGLFHHHLPFLHPVSFKPAKVSPSLLLAVLSIGALYAFGQNQAYICHIGSKVLVNQFLQNKENFSSRKCPLWTMQSSLLNMIFASWSGDPKGLEWTCSIKSLLANMVAGNRYELKLRTEARNGRQPTRAEWVEDEGCRRTYYAAYIFFGLLTLTYNHTPAISFHELEHISLPSTENMWNLKVDEDTWAKQTKDATPIPSFRKAHDSLFQGESLHYSAFAARVMINALFLGVWYHKRSPEALQDVVTEYRLRLALETWEQSLNLKEAHLNENSDEEHHEGHPLTFNAIAMFRNTRARLEVDLKSIQEALRYHDCYEVAAAMSKARDQVRRSSELLKVIQECFNYLEIAALQGFRWMTRTSATNWSVEHPLCGLDLMVILSLWLYRLENDGQQVTEGESAMYHKIQTLLHEESIECHSTKLSSVVARLWGSMIDEVVVWGITKVMGDSFRLHSQALVGYEDENDASTVSTPSMSSQGLDDNEDSLY
ncbi:hypothetical protein K3495_g8056 [Podosphaera aphanis]|nr:hypothetical protein K3495_g8056 [Podosphaera aphanis]